MLSPYRAKLATLLAMTTLLVHCSGPESTTTQDMSAPNDMGNSVLDATMTPTDQGETPRDMSQAVDLSPDASVSLPTCELATDRGWELCTTSGTRCELVFNDGTGCADACAALGRRCVDSFEDQPGMCASNLDLPALNCADTGHQSDYCICDGIVQEQPDAAPDMMDITDMMDMLTPVDMSLERPYENLLLERVGFGRDVTGGAGGPRVRVTTLADSGPGSLREAASTPGAAWITFDISGIIALQSEIQVSSDKTIDGRGSDIAIENHGLYVSNGAGNVILAYLKLRNSDSERDDLIRFFNGGTGMWVHHCSLSNGKDGAFDATEDVSNVTVSYTHIFDHDKAMLIGAGSDDGDGERMRWTGHHNWYEDCVQRLPAIRMGRAHAFNNVYQWRGGTAFSVNIAPAQMLQEHNIFNPQTIVGHKLVSQSEKRAAVKIRDNLEMPYPGDEIEYTEFMPETVFDPLDTYPYSPEPATMELMTRVQAEAGWQQVPLPE